MDIGKYPKFFQPQIERLLQCGYPKALGINDEDFCENYLDSVLHTDYVVGLVREGYKPDTNRKPPVLIVIPDKVLPVSEQMALIDLGGQKGRSLIYSHHLEYTPKYRTQRDDWQEPTSAYLITGVSDGGNFVGYHDEESRLNLIANTAVLHPLNVAEGIALLNQFPKSLYKHPLALLGSTFAIMSGSCGNVPTIERDRETGAPLLSMRSRVNLWPYATPTCVRRIIVP